MKPRVLTLVGSFGQGGSERQAIQVSALLRDTQRYDVQIACLDPTGPLRKDAEAVGFKEIPSFPLTSFYDANAARQLRKFVRFLRTKRIQILQTYDFYTNLFGMAGAALARTPVKIAARRETTGVRTPAQSWTERRAFSLATRVVANSEAVREELIRDGLNPLKIVTVYNGVDTRRIFARQDVSRQELLANLKLPQTPSRRFVSIVANMRHEMKDQRTFLRAAQLVKGTVSDVAFVLAGEGPLVDEYKAFAKELGLADQAFFLNHCSAVADLLTISDVCVLSSKGVEGFSNSIAEYMAAARPVVATNVGGASEAIVQGETGYIVEPGDHFNLANRITELLQNPELAKTLGLNGLRVVKAKFSCEAQLGRIESLYNQLLFGTSSATMVDEPNRDVAAIERGHVVSKS